MVIDIITILVKILQFPMLEGFYNLKYEKELLRKILIKKLRLS